MTEKWGIIIYKLPKNQSWLKFVDKSHDLMYN